MSPLQPTNPDKSGRWGRLSIVIPTINRADLLEESLQSLKLQVNRFHELIIIDNGFQHITTPFENCRIINSTSNLGVAGSWNLGVQMALDSIEIDNVLVLNDDVVLDTSQLDEIDLITSRDDAWLLVGPLQWSAWVINRAGVEAVMRKDNYLFDERFFPAYFEDNDFMYRFSSYFPNKVKVGVAALNPKVFRRNSSSKKDARLRNNFESNRAYYQTKWGGGVGSELRRPGDPLTLELCYEFQCAVTSDINEHLVSLFELSSACQHVSHLGTGPARATWGLMMARPKALVCYDRTKSANILLLEEIACAEGIDFRFVEGEIEDADVEETEMLLIDDFHAYLGLVKALKCYAPRTKKFIVLHDTVSFGYQDETFDGEVLAKRGMIAALVDFLQDPEGEDWEHFGTDVGNNGLTVLVRKSSGARPELFEC